MALSIPRVSSFSLGEYAVQLLNSVDEAQVQPQTNYTHSLDTEEASLEYRQPQGSRELQWLKALVAWSSEPSTKIRTLSNCNSS